jgi:hypothetical protein
MHVFRLETPVLLAVFPSIKNSSSHSTNFDSTSLKKPGKQSVLQGREE